MHLTSYLRNLEGVSPGASESAGRSVSVFINKYIEHFSYMDHVTGLLLGHVQSGKTGQMLGVVSGAADCGFKLFIVLTPDNIVLYRQTINRAFRMLDTFNICGETDSDRFLQGDLRQPALVVLKKNSSVLRNWLRFLKALPRSQTEPIIIVDDEAYVASLNTRINQREISTINRLLLRMRTVSQSSIYIQVTATPQAPLLQARQSGWKPSFVHIIEPGKGYVGGKFFYSSESTCQHLIDPNEREELLGSDVIPEGLRQSIFSFLVTGICLVLLKEFPANLMLIHPSFRICDHETVADKTRFFFNILAKGIKENDSFLHFAFLDSYRDMQRTVTNLPPFEAVKARLKDAIEQTSIIVLNSISQVGRDYGRGLNIIIGGNTLGRGVTFPSLHTVYYCRSTRTPLNDTMWQHSRVFGYDRIPGFCRLYIPPRLSSLYRVFTESQNTLFSTLRTRGTDGITILVPEGSRPTRRSVVELDKTILVVGGVNYFINSPLPSQIDELDGILGMHDIERNIGIDNAIAILSLLDTEEDEKDTLKSFKSCLDALKISGQQDCRLIVRAGRNISKNTGTMLSENDRVLAGQTDDISVLVMYRLNGLVEDGWDGAPRWMANIKYPNGYCFYSSAI